MRSLALLLLLACSTPLASCQASNAALAELRSKIQGHSFVLRDFSAENTSSYNFANNLLESASPPSVKSFALFLVTDLTLSDSVLTIQGKRKILVQNTSASTLATYPVAVPALVNINLGSADLTTVFPRLIAQLFFASPSLAIDAIPTYLRHSIPLQVDAKGNPSPSCSPCTRWIRQGTWHEISPPANGLKNPIVMKSTDVEMTRAADLARVNSTVSFTYVVDENGHVTELWLTRAAGYDLEESSAKALRKQIFAPARYLGTPVATTINQEFHFSVGGYQGR
jgi:hypothetical protein